MKQILIMSLVAMSSASAFAQPINLSAGSSIVINGDVVTCEGPSENELPPPCSLRQDGSYYRLYVGNTVAETFPTFNSAVEGAKKLKEAGLCR